MTYCAAININDGLVFASDSRTNAGVDYISTVSKMHILTPANDRIFIILTAGNLATTQEVMNHLRRDIDTQGHKNLLRCNYVFEAAAYIGQVSQIIQQQHRSAFSHSGISGEATFIIGGQIQQQKQELYMVYPQGNYISVSEETPFMQIGESKYGKPVLDRMTHLNISLDDAARLLLVSLDSTRRANISVGPPYEIAMLPYGQLQPSRHIKFSKKSEKLDEINQSWGQGIIQAFMNLPKFDWEENVETVFMQEVQQQQ